MRARLCCWVAALAAVVTPLAVAGQLLAPGKLARVHAELEGLANCTQCHTAGQQIAAGRCLACHGQLAARLRAGLGYHARVDTTCVDCHSEHRGLDYALIRWDRDAFDHDSTGYALSGRHAAVGCEGCHKDPATYLGLDPACRSCHADEHRGQLAADCSSCHGFDGWRPSRFDHAQARFPLAGRHAVVACEQCHPAAVDSAGARFTRYRPLPFAQCGDCHADVHGGQFTADCSACHRVAGWQPVPVDHERTRFPLRGRHTQVACTGCHRPAAGSGGAPVTVYRGLEFAACRSCHEDVHRGQFSEDCSACHTVAGWESSPVDHERTRFPLRGRHAQVACAACHGPRPEEGPGAVARYRGLRFGACGDCHADIHRGQFQEDCSACHTVSSWELIGFDHGATRFPLEGQHAAVTCDQCHPQQPGTPAQVSFVQYRGVRHERCTDCHADHHAAQFSQDCAACHVPEGFAPSSFDHDRATFRLDGAHTEVACEGCHPRFVAADGRSLVRYRPIPADCAACHE